MYGNCEDSYRPVIIGFVQYQHSSVQLVLKKMDRHTKLRTTSGTMNIHQQSSPLGHHKHRGIHYHKGKQNKWSKQIEFSAESNQFEKNQKWE